MTIEQRIFRFAGQSGLWFLSIPRPTTGDSLTFKAFKQFIG